MAFTGYLMSGGDIVAEIAQDRITPVRRDRMPLYLAGGGPLEKWLESRAIDRHRPNSRILKKVLRLSDTSDIAAVLRAHAAVITDDYWLKAQSEPELQYEQVRFTENRFAELALYGHFDSYGRQDAQKQILSRTPELTNIGSYEKCWKLEDGAWYMHKRGSPLEQFSELFIAALGAEMGFAMAEYEQAGDHIRTRNFTEGALNLEPAAALVGDNEDYELNYGRIEALAPGLGAQYLDILYMDALCFNMDRHTFNYGFLRDRTTGRVLSMAPNFDNNIALISRGYTEEPQRTNGLLINLFLELLEARGIVYQAPPLEPETLRRLAGSIMQGETIDREYVVTMVSDRHERLNAGIRALTRKQGDSPRQTR